MHRFNLPHLAAGLLVQCSSGCARIMATDIGVLAGGETSGRLLEQKPLAASPPSPPDLFYLDDDSQAVAGLNVAASAVGAIRDPSMSSVGDLLVQASTLAPLLTLVAGPAAPVVGFTLMSAGTMMGAWGDEGDEAPTAADVLERMDEGFEELSGKADVTLEAVEANRKYLEQLLTYELEGEELGFRLFEDIRRDFEQAKKEFRGRAASADAAELQVHENDLRTEVMGSKNKYEDQTVASVGKLGMINFQKIIKYGINQGQEDDSLPPTFCRAAGLVQHFIATRHRLLWLMLMESNFKYSGQRDLLVADMGKIVERYNETMASYDRVLRGVPSNDLLRAVASGESQCRKEAFGLYCNQGQAVVQNNVTVGCQCDVMWSGEQQVGETFPSDAIAAPYENLLSVKTPDNGALRHECFRKSIGCSLNEASYLKNKEADFALAWWDGNLFNSEVLHASGRHGFSWSGDANTIWQLRSDGGNRVFLYNVQKERFLKSCDTELELQESGSTCETWKVEWGGPDGVRFSNVKGRYLSIRPDDQNAEVLSGPNGGWSLFQVFRDPYYGLPCPPEDGVFRSKGGVPGNEEILGSAENLNLKPVSERTEESSAKESSSTEESSAEESSTEESSTEEEESYEDDSFADESFADESSSAPVLSAALSVASCALLAARAASLLA